MADPAVVELVLQTGGERRVFPLGDAPSGIGRSPQNAIVLQSEMISRNHAMVQKNESGGYSVFDLGSRNGTFLNGAPLNAPAPLRNGDVLSIGPFVLVFSDARATKAVAHAAASDSPQTALHFALREITILVMDIRDFTGLSREVGEERIAPVMAAFNRDAGAILAAAGAWAVKHIGDAVMAIWDHRHCSAVSAVRTALQAIVSVRNLSAGFQAQFGLPRPLAISAGINTGLASLGNLGSAMTSDYTALGDVVNKAFRLETSTRGLNTDLAFGDEVYRLLGDLRIPGVCVQRIQLKGYSEPCNVYTLPAASIPELLSFTTEDEAVRRADR